MGATKLRPALEIVRTIVSVTQHTGRTAQAVLLGTVARAAVNVTPDTKSSSRVAAPFSNPASAATL